MYLEKGEHPPCEDCIPELMPENHDTARAWGYCQDQYVMGFGGPVAIRLEAIETAVRMVEPEDPAATTEKLIRLGRSVIADINEQKEADREQT